ncbi:MAG: aminotransferase class V-fold PLP-dependent enzyme [Burkholderiales bacterium]|nr:aminotransferase class V-fold PLP-dependent enzyme [Burkholderiales bacterium]
MNRPTSDFAAIAAARADYPALERWTYLDVAGRCVLSRATRATLDECLDGHMLNGADKKACFAMIERTRGRFGELIGAASADEIAYAKNVSDAINMVATAWDWRKGDNVLLCPALEHPNNVYPWLNMRRHGLEVRSIAPREGHVPVDEMIERMDAGTRMAAVSTVTFSPGFRTEVARLGRACRERDVLLLVDAAQSVGVLHTDVRESLVDALAVSTQKGLLGLYGMGFLYCRREWAERLKPAYLARFGVDLGAADSHEASMGDEEYRLMPGARRFDLGNYNYSAAAAAETSMSEIMRLGTSNIEAYVCGLARALAQGFLDLGLPVSGGAPGPHLAHIVTVGKMSDNHYGTGEDLYNRLYAHLEANRVKLSIRRGMLRFSLHLYNNADDVARVLELTREFLGRHSGGADARR